MNFLPAEFVWSIAVLSILYLLVSDRSTRGNWEYWIPGLFFLSGFPALVYQIVWQRVLFALFGSDIQSVTIVVTTFILGLGLGSLLSGWLSAKVRAPLIAFGVLELSVGLLAAASLPIFHRLTAFLARLPDLPAAIVVIFALLVPTIFMGATLPMLVAHLSRSDPVTVGISVGRLYFVNTLGSAIACFICAQFAMHVLGESGTVLAGSALNITIGLFVLSSSKNRPVGATHRPIPAQSVHPITSELTFPIALMLSAFTGFVALAYEILWFRLYSFADGGHAPAFAYLLGSYLFGIAYGSLFAERASRTYSDKLGLIAIGVLTLAFNVVAFLVAPLLAFLSHRMFPAATLPVIAIAAAALGSIFPLLANAIAPGMNAGKNLGGLYFANMAGAATGSLVLGYVLTDYLSLRQIALALLLLGVAAGTLMVTAAGQRVRPILLSSGIVVVLISISPWLFQDAFERMVLKRDYKSGEPFVHTIENRNGIIAVALGGTVYGGGVYDGRFNTDLIADSNLILRCYAVSAFHPSPKKVLLIGLSSGSWAQVLANHPQLEQLQVVEINPGYLKLIPRYPEVSSLLQNPKVTITIDDGRRWLRRNPTSRFDVIVMNTTYHWRSNITNLLSEEFLNLARRHLRPGGVLYYNTTSSPEAQFTAATVFPYALRIANFVAVSDAPITLDLENLRKILEQYRIDGRRVLDPTDENQGHRLAQILAILHPQTEGDDQNFLSSELGDSLRHRLRGNRLVTDDNMATEW